MLLPPEAPVMTLPNATLFPQAMLPLFIFEPRYRKMLAESLATHRTFVVSMRRPELKRESPSLVAGLGLIRACVQNKDGTSHVVLQGLVRVALGKVSQYKPYRVQRFEPMPTVIEKKERVVALAAKVMDLVPARLKQGMPIPFPPTKDSQSEGGPQSKPFSSQQVLRHLRSLQDPCQMADLVSCSLLTTPWQRQIILETVDLEERLTFLVQFLMTEIRNCSKQTP